MPEITPSKSEQVEKPRRKKWTPIGIVCLFFYAFLCLYAVVPLMLHTELYDSVVMVPTKYQAADFEKANKIGSVVAEDHYFENGHGDKLHAWLFRYPSSKKIVVYHHGNAGNIATRTSAAAALHGTGLSVFMYDYRGYGRSSGVPTIKGSLEDGQAAVSYVEDKLKYADKNIINYGESLGSGVATAVAADKPFGGLLLESPVGSLPMVGRLHFLFLKPYPDFLFPNPHFANVQTIKDVHSPVLIFHGKLDTMIPYSQAEEIFASANAPKRLIMLKDSGHNSISSADDVRAYLGNIADLVSDKLK